MPYLPAEIVTRWSMTKKNVADSLAKVKPGGVLKKETIATLKKNLDGFDSGLTPKLKKAAAAKTPQDAAQSLHASVEIIKAYKTKIADWGHVGAGVATGLTRVLNEVQAACETAAANLPH